MDVALIDPCGAHERALPLSDEALFVLLRVAHLEKSDGIRAFPVAKLERPAIHLTLETVGASVDGCVKELVDGGLLSPVKAGVVRKTPDGNLVGHNFRVLWAQESVRSGARAPRANALDAIPRLRALMQRRCKDEDR